MKRSIQTLLLAGLMAFFSGCAPQSILTPKTTKPQIDPNLPKVKQVRTLSDMTAIALEWTPIYGGEIEGYNIYRAKDSGSAVLIKTIKDRYSSHYLDDGLEPDTTYVYRITAYQGERESTPSDPVRAKTLPAPEPVPFVTAVDHLPRKAKIIWRPHPNLRVDGYIIERGDTAEGAWKKVATLKGRLQAEYIDKRLKDNRVYFYRVIAKTCDGVLSAPSAVVKASTKPRPSMVRGLKASRGLPRKIELEWQPNPEPDIDHYKIYRSIFEIGPYLSIAKTKQTHYTDPVNEDGVKRYYKVTAVDKDGLESFKQDSPAVGETLPKPKPPIITQKRFDGTTLYLEWFSPDNRAVSYIVKKREILGLLKYKEYEYKNITSTHFSDSNLKPDAKYIYRVYAVDRYGLVSKPSEAVEIVTR